MHEAVNGLLKRDEIRDIPIGLLPAGSGNSLLHDIGKFDIKTTLNKILNHNTQTIDVLKITSSDMIYYSINLVGWGMVNEIGILAEKMRCAVSRSTIPENVDQSKIDALHLKIYNVWQERTHYENAR